MIRSLVSGWASEYAIAGQDVPPGDLVPAGGATLPEHRGHEAQPAAARPDADPRDVRLHDRRTRAAGGGVHS